MTTLFKYQVQGEESFSRHVPMLVVSQWKYEQNQTGVILLCRANPAFGTSLDLQDLEVMITMEGIIETTQSKPAAAFNKRSNRLSWHLNNTTLRADQDIKLVARFRAAESAKSTGTIDLRWRTSPSSIPIGSGLLLSASWSSKNPFSEEAGPVEISMPIQSQYSLHSSKYTVTS